MLINTILLFQKNVSTYIWAIFSILYYIIIKIIHVLLFSLKWNAQLTCNMEECNYTSMQLSDCTYSSAAPSQAH